MSMKINKYNVLWIIGAIVVLVFGAQVLFEGAEFTSNHVIFFGGFVLFGLGYYLDFMYGRKKKTA